MARNKHVVIRGAAPFRRDYVGVVGGRNLVDDADEALREGRRIVGMVGGAIGEEALFLGKIVRGFRSAICRIGETRFRVGDAGKIECQR